MAIIRLHRLTVSPSFSSCGYGPPNETPPRAQVYRRDHEKPQHHIGCCNAPIQALNETVIVIHGTPITRRSMHTLAGGLMQTCVHGQRELMYD